MMMAAMYFGQSLHWHDLAIVAFLIVLEGTLSVDNALVLGLLAKRLPPHQRRKALTYGLVGAFLFRFIAIAVATVLLEWPIFKLLGGGYLLYVAIKHFLFSSGSPHDEHEIQLDARGHPVFADEAPVADTVSTAPAHAPLEYESAVAPGGAVRVYAAFWPTVFVIELTDIAFAVDSIVAAMGFIPRHTGEGVNPKLWIVITGGFFGVILMRFAAMIFIKLLDRFPRFETAAYLLVTVIGGKLVIDYVAHTLLHWEWVNFHSVKSPAFWVFWVAMIVCFAIGFWGRRKPDAPEIA